MDSWECKAYCGICVAKLDCWTDGDLLSSTQDECKTTCYDTCDDTLGDGHALCDCSHGACILGCETNCTELERCYADCVSTGITGDCSALCDLCVTTK